MLNSARGTPDPPQARPSGMKWLSAGLIFVNFSTVCGLILGMAANGLGQPVAVASLLLGAVAAIFTYLRTSDPKTKIDILDSAEPEVKLPSDEDLDRVMAFFEKMWRRLVAMVQKMQKEIDGK